MCVDGLLSLIEKQCMFVKYIGNRETYKEENKNLITMVVATVTLKYFQLLIVYFLHSQVHINIQLYSKILAPWSLTHVFL